MDRALEIEGELRIDHDGGSARVEIRDEAVDLHLADARSALALMRQVPRASRRDGLRRADAALRGAGLVGRVRVAGRVVARLGGNAEPDALARLLRVDPLALSLFSLIGAVLDPRRPPGPAPAAPSPPDPPPDPTGAAPGPMAGR